VSGAARQADHRPVKPTDHVEDQEIENGPKPNNIGGAINAFNLLQFHTYLRSNLTAQNKLQT
jgi:hypothetical protein